MGLGPFDYALWLIGLLAEAYVVARSFYRKEFLRYFELNLYMLVVALNSVLQFFAIRALGFDSVAYRYFYFYADSLLTILLYFAILGLYQHVFQEMAVSRYIRGGAILLLGATASFSYMVVHQNANNLTGKFVLELSQNLYFVGVVLTYVLWGAVMQLKETRVRIVQVVLSLGIYFSGLAAGYALRNMFPAARFPVLASAFELIPPMLGTFLPLAWAYTFTKFSEEARLATAQLATAR